jgi:hypothetical protein
MTHKNKNLKNWIAEGRITYSEDSEIDLGANRL